MGITYMDWRVACIVPLYKGKGDMYECSNSGGIRLLSFDIRILPIWTGLLHV